MNADQIRVHPRRSAAHFFRCFSFTGIWENLSWSAGFLCRVSQHSFGFSQDRDGNCQTSNRNRGFREGVDELRHEDAQLLEGVRQILKGIWWLPERNSENLEENPQRKPGLLTGALSFAAKQKI